MFEELDKDKLEDAKKIIDEEVKANKVILYMKGNKMAPQCGFSGQVIQILMQSGVPFETRDVLEDDYRRQGIKDYSDWPTVPQLYVNQEFIGGCDIVVELFQSGELNGLLEG